MEQNSEQKLELKYPRSILYKKLFLVGIYCESKLAHAHHQSISFESNLPKKFGNSRRCKVHVTVATLKLLVVLLRYDSILCRGGPPAFQIKVFYLRKPADKKPF